MKLKSGFLGLGLSGVVLLLAFFAGGLFPFGSGTISWCDMNQQAIPLLCAFKDILAGKDGVFINLANGGGMNLYGVIFFFLSNPFSFLAAFVSKANIPFLMNVLVILKLCTAGFTAAFCLAEINKKSTTLFNGFLGGCYALCGYGMLFYQNIMWLDIMYLFPIIFLGLWRLSFENRPLTLMISLSLCVVLNFYISFMVYLFVICYFGVFALFNPKADRKIYVNLGLCGIFSLMASAVVIIPCFLQYAASGRSSSVLSELTNSSFFAHTETTLPLLFCSGIILAVFIFIIPRFISLDKITKMLTALYFLTALPLLIEPINIMWHTGSYMSFPARYGFITVFVGLVLVSKELSKIKFAEKSNKICFLGGILVIAVSGAFAVAFTKKNLAELSNYVSTLWGDKFSFRGLLFLLLVMTTLYFGVTFISYKSKFTKNAAALLLCGILAFEGFCSTTVYMTSVKEKFSLYNYQSYIKMAEQLPEDELYRVNMSGKLIDANMTGAAGAGSISHYTSLNDKTFMEAAKQMGYSGYWMETGNWDGSIISDALLNVKYTVYSENDGFTAKENPYYLPLGIKAVGEISEQISDYDRLYALGESFGKLTATTNPVIEYSIKDVQNCNYYKQDNLHHIDYYGEDGEIHYGINVKEKQTIYFDCYNGFSNNLVEEINDSFKIYVNGVLFSESYPTQRNNGLLKLGSFQNQKVNITLIVKKNVECSSFGVFGVDETKFATTVKSISGLEFQQNGSTLKAEIKSGGSYFLSLPYRTDYEITFNGENIEYTKALSGFIALDISNSGTLEITAKPKGFTLGLSLSVVGITLILLFILFRKRLENYPKIFANIVYGIFLGVFASMILSVYIIPIMVNLWDFMI